MGDESIHTLAEVVDIVFHLGKIKTAHIFAESAQGIFKLWQFLENLLNAIVVFSCERI